MKLHKFLKIFEYVIASVILGAIYTNANKLYSENNAIKLVWNSTKGETLEGKLGIALPSAVGESSPCGESIENESCITYGDYANLTITETFNNENELNCTRVQWISTYARQLQDCFAFTTEMHLYGGGTTYNQTWPLNHQTIPESPFVTGDYTSTLTGAKYGGVIENYFLFSSGIVVHVDEDVPLFVKWDPTSDSQLCISAKNDHPYKFTPALELKYDVCVGKNVKHVHQQTYKKFYEKPSGSPDQDMILKPFWSTWNEFNANVNQTIVLEHARRILAEGFTSNSHFEIDDGWETCYGQNTFNPVKFPDTAGMVRDLKAMGFGVTLWTHPFINYECREHFDEAFEKGFLLKDNKGKVAFTEWWHGDAGVLDFTNSEARTWWLTRLKNLQNEYGVDSFKFDAGETDRLPWELIVEVRGRRTTLF